MTKVFVYSDNIGLGFQRQGAEMENLICSLEEHWSTSWSWNLNVSLLEIMMNKWPVPKWNDMFMRSRRSLWNWGIWYCTVGLYPRVMRTSNTIFIMSWKLASKLENSPLQSPMWMDHISVRDAWHTKCVDMMSCSSHQCWTQQTAAAVDQWWHSPSPVVIRCWRRLESTQKLLPIWLSSIGSNPGVFQGLLLWFRSTTFVEPLDVYGLPQHNIWVPWLFREYSKQHLVPRSQTKHRFSSLSFVSTS